MKIIICKNGKAFGKSGSDTTILYDSREELEAAIASNSVEWDFDLS